ncbi:hypothetical protein [Streptomyces sp. NPDC095613]|uniref:hypothetical protein n=1 Tax=Streptomyces sp. NPDC095613 TaxID=3155540 RepID=UPI00331F68BC
MAPHHHAYVWLGHGDVLVRPGDAHRRPGHPEFAAAQVMPLESADWLLKDASRVEATFAEPAEAADWYAGRLARHLDAFVGTYAPGPEPDEISRRLAARADVVGGWWVTGGRFLSVNLIACSPHGVRREYGCPARQPGPQIFVSPPGPGR